MATQDIPTFYDKLAASSSTLIIFEPTTTVASPTLVVIRYRDLRFIETCPCSIETTELYRVHAIELGVAQVGLLEFYVSVYCVMRVFGNCHLHDEAGFNKTVRNLWPETCFRSHVDADKILKLSSHLTGKYCSIHGNL